MLLFILTSILTALLIMVAQVIPEWLNERKEAKVKLVKERKHLRLVK